MKNVRAPKYVPGLNFLIVKHLAMMLPQDVLLNGQRNFLQPFNVSGFESSNSRARYKSLEGFRVDCSSLCIELNRFFGPLCIIVRDFSEIDPGSAMFLDIAQRLFGWQIAVDPKIKQEDFPISESEKHLLSLLAFGKPVEFKSTLDLASRYMQSGDQWTCIALLTKLHTEYSTDPEKAVEVLYWMLESHSLAGNLDRALLLSNMILSLEPQPLRRSHTHYLRAMMSTRQGEFINRHFINPLKELEAARKICDGIELKNSDYFSELAVLENGYALLSYTIGDGDRALDSMSRSEGSVNHLSEIDPAAFDLMRPVVLSNQARIHMQAGRLNEAIELQSRVLEMEPDYLENYVHLARMYMQSDVPEHFDAAISVLNDAIKLVPGDPTLYEMKAQLDDEPEENFLKAIQFSRTAPGESDSVVFNYCGWLHEQELFEKAKPWLVTLSETCTDQFIFENAVSMLADIKIRTESREAAISLMEPYTRQPRFKLITENFKDLQTV